MNTIQTELDGEGFGDAIQILGVNGIGHESGNPSVTSGRDLPWLQDTAAGNVWVSWAVGYRDVVVLDGENRPIAIYNLTLNDLGVPANHDALKAILIDAATP